MTGSQRSSITLVGSISDENDKKQGDALRLDTKTTKSSERPQTQTPHPIRAFPTWESYFSHQWNLLCAFWDNSWAPELLSCLVAVLALSGLLLVLGIYQGRVLQDLPIKISINTLIAIFATIIKVSLAMPVAEGAYSRK